jgi:hypothetical protein
VTAKIAKNRVSLNAMDGLDAKLDFATAILTLIIAAEDDPPAFSRLNSGLQIHILDGLRTLLEGAQADADAAYNAGQPS